jgi:hypothetical protein
MSSLTLRPQRKTLMGETSRRDRAANRAVIRQDDPKKHGLVTSRRRFTRQRSTNADARDDERPAEIGASSRPLWGPRRRALCEQDRARSDAGAYMPSLSFNRIERCARSPRKIGTGCRALGTPRTRRLEGGPLQRRPGPHSARQHARRIIVPYDVDVLADRPRSGCGGERLAQQVHELGARDFSRSVSPIGGG